MKITVEGTTYEYDTERLTVSEGILLEQLTGMTFQQWQNGLTEFRPMAVKGLVYLLKLRAGEKQDWLTLDFDLGSIDFPEDEEPPVPTVAEVARSRSKKTGPATSASSATSSAA